MSKYKKNLASSPQSTILNEFVTANEAFYPGHLIVTPPTFYLL
jgi:hypothetical protein